MLSGGEKARLALAKFMLTQGTFLVLDEPTNHLDIPSKEMLEEALMKFEGSVIAVSHDRYFLKKIATRVVTVSLHHVKSHMCLHFQHSMRGVLHQLSIQVVRSSH